MTIWPQRSLAQEHVSFVRIAGWPPGSACAALVLRVGQVCGSRVLRVCYDSRVLRVNLACAAHSLRVSDVHKQC